MTTRHFVILLFVFQATIACRQNGDTAREKDYPRIRMPRADDTIDLTGRFTQIVKSAMRVRVTYEREYRDVPKEITREKVTRDLSGSELELLSVIQFVPTP